MFAKLFQRDRYAVGCLAIASLLLYLWRLGQLPLRDWDEATVAMVAREMLQTGSWLHPTLYGEPYLNKPPLVEWLMASTFAVGGVNEWTARLVPALITAAAVPLLYWLGRELFENRKAALWSALVYLNLLPVARHGRLAMRDGVAITLFLLLSVAVLKARHRQRWAVVAGLAFGGMMLAKGILAVLLAGIIFIFLLADGQWKLLRSGYAWAGLALGCLPAIAWYAAQFQHYGADFWQAHFLSQSLDRVWSVVERNQGPPWYYVSEILKYGWPWLLFWPGGMRLAWQNRDRAWGKWIWIGTVIYLGTISVMGTKLPWYVMPLYPFMALTMGSQIATLSDRKNDIRWLGALLFYLTIVLV
ncbi:MAG: glycosyltransferase family 39 protein [Cyanobacteria bacterium J06639_1]